MDFSDLIAPLDVETFARRWWGRRVLHVTADLKLRRSIVSVAEVEAQDQRQLAVLGLAMVSNEAHHVKAALGQIVEALRVHPVAELLDHEVDTY